MFVWTSCSLQGCLQPNKSYCLQELDVLSPSAEDIVANSTSHRLLVCSRHRCVAALTLIRVSDWRCFCCLCICRVLGFWLALTFSTALQASAFGILISRFNWPSEVQRAAAMLRAAHHAREAQ